MWVIFVYEAEAYGWWAVSRLFATSEQAQEWRERNVPNEQYLEVTIKFVELNQPHEGRGGNQE